MERQFSLSQVNQYNYNMLLYILAIIEFLFGNTQIGCDQEETLQQDLT